MRFRVYTGTRASGGAVRLARALRALGYNSLRLKRRNSRYRPREDDVVINWGVSTPTGFAPATVINAFENVANCVNKLKTFRVICSTDGTTSGTENELSPNIKVPRWATTVEEFYESCTNSDETAVMVRSTLTGHSGQGAHYCDGREAAEAAAAEYGCKLVTAYIRKQHEWRVHVVNGKIIDIQIKRKRRGGDADSYVRNHGNGWVYCRDDVDAPNNVRDCALIAARRLGTQICAVDIMTTSNGVAWLLEVNTAPGLVGSSPGLYAEEIQELV